MVTRRLEGCKAGSGKFVRSGREGNKAGRVRTGVENAPEWGCRNRVTVVTSLQSVSSPSLTADFGLSSLRSISSSGLAADFGLSSLRSISSSGLAADFGFPPCALSVPFLWNDHGLRSVSSDDLRSSSVPVSRVLQGYRTASRSGSARSGFLLPFFTPGKKEERDTERSSESEIKLRYACLTSFLLGKVRKRSLFSLRASVAASLRLRFSA